MDTLSLTINLTEVKEKILSNGYFASRNIDELLEHELAHTEHWDAAKRFQKSSPKRYNTVEVAKNVLDADFVSYIKRQMKTDPMYLLGLSEYASVSFERQEYNEILAEAVLKPKFDENLTKIIERMLKNDGDSN